MNKSIKNMSTNELKEEYITLALGKMIFDAETEQKRKEISEEIERR